MVLKTIYIRSYVIKLKYFITLIIFLILAVLLLYLIIRNNSTYKLTVDNHLTLLCPAGLKVNSIYINQQIPGRIVKTSYTMDKPYAQKFSDYTALEGKFFFKYPSAFILNEQNFSGSEILYHVDFHDKQQTLHGFIQVWELPYDLKKFLEKSKSLSMQDFKYFSSTPIVVNDVPGYYWDYCVLTDHDKPYKGCEIFLKKDEYMYRISFFTPEKLWNEKWSNILWDMVNSFKIH